VSFFAPFVCPFLSFSFLFLHSGPSFPFSVLVVSSLFKLQQPEDLVRRRISEKQKGLTVRFLIGTRILAWKRGFTPRRDIRIHKCT